MSENTDISSDVTAVILAGGMSRRLGRNKAVEPFQGEPMVRRVIHRMGKIASNVIVVANDDERVTELDLPDNVTPVIDEYPGKGSLGGIYTGLTCRADRVGDLLRLRYALSKPPDSTALCCPTATRTTPSYLSWTAGLSRYTPPTLASVSNPSAIN